MNLYVALLRGINVGGHKRIKMSDLKDLLAQVGLTKIHTYIQSGNVVFGSTLNDRTLLSQSITAAIKKHYGFDVAVVVLSQKKFTAILQATPFEDSKRQKSVFTLLDPPLSKEQLSLLQEMSFEDELVYSTRDCVYVFAEKGYHKVTCNTNFIERKTRVHATTRNFKTMQAIARLLDEQD